MVMLTSELYFEQDLLLKKFLKNNDYYSITTDGWSSKKKKKAVISLTMHYLDIKYVLQNISLGIIPADYEHSAQKLSDHLNKLFEKYGILDRVSIIVVDHASTMGATCKELGREFHGCFAHFLNLVCKMFFDNIKKKDCDFDVSPEQTEYENESENETNSKDLVCENLSHESYSNFNSIILSDIEEETEEDLAGETIGFNSSNFDSISLES